MAKITIAQLQTSDSYINELTATEMDATKGGLLNEIGLEDLTAGLVAVDDVLNKSLNNNKTLSGNEIEIKF